MVVSTVLYAEEKKGGLCLQFDDGWTSWATVIAPELKRVGGLATGFINNQHMESGRITAGDLLSLQNDYGWEIGSHTYHHLNAPRFVKQHGVQKWVDEELDPSLSGLRAIGIDVQSLVFPFNASTPELAEAIRGKVTSFRRADSLAMADGIRADGSLPGTSIDTTVYTPLLLILQWIDMAHEQGTTLFLYGHRILPDSAFAIGKIAKVESNQLVAEQAITPEIADDLVLVIDLEKRNRKPTTYRIMKIEGNTVTVDRDDLEDIAAAGDSFLIGPAYGTRLSDFRQLIEYASTRLTFYRVRDIATNQHKEDATATVPAQN